MPTIREIITEHLIGASVTIEYPGIDKRLEHVTLNQCDTDCLYGSDGSIEYVIPFAVIACIELPMATRIQFEYIDLTRKEPGPNLDNHRPPVIHLV